MRIVDLKKSQTDRIRQCAMLLMSAFPGSEGWPDFASAVSEVHESLEKDRISRVAIGAAGQILAGQILGWAGGIPHYDGHVWELHPLVVHPDYRNQAIGSALLDDFEEQVRSRGGLTITLGTDDTGGSTTLSGCDLYQGLWNRIANIQNLGRHPYEFYLKKGYVITGVVPDANGPGKPDILMSKRVATSERKQI